MKKIIYLIFAFSFALILAVPKLVSAMPPPPASHIWMFTPFPTVVLSASLTSISSGGSSTLTWTSTNADSCTAVSPSGWTTKTGINDNQVVSPTLTTIYTMTCTGPGGTSTPATATVTVGSAPIGATPSGIRVIVSWDEKGTQKSLELNTFVQ